MRTFLAGHTGLVGSTMLPMLRQRGEAVITRSRAELDLTDQVAVRAFMARERPDRVIVAAARVGGIHANNTYPADFIADNLMIAVNLISAAHANGVERLLYLGSSCIYPREAAQPMAESALLSGMPEPTNEPYAIAKIAGIKLCESYNRQYITDFRSVVPCNLYGPGDNFDPANAHVLPALIRRFHAAVESKSNAVSIWGSGRPRREFLHVADMCAAALLVLDLDPVAYRAMTSSMQSHINIGSGEDIAIADLARLVAGITGFGGEIGFDATMPDGTPRKLLDVTRLSALGWRPAISLEQGIESTYRWYLTNHANLRDTSAAFH
jgi:GDP-L-fucose synthase